MKAKKIVSVLLIAMLMLSLFPASALAASVIITTFTVGVRISGREIVPYKNIES